MVQMKSYLFVLDNGSQTSNFYIDLLELTKDSVQELLKDLKKSAKKDDFCSKDFVILNIIKLG